MDTILTDANGVPFERPRREDYTDPVEYVLAYYAFKDSVTQLANSEFDRAFIKELKCSPRRK